MANENILSWNFANWVTVSLIVIVTFTIFGFGAKYMQQQVNS